MDKILNNIKIAGRSFNRDKLNSWIKICSFTIGFAACVLITFFVGNELRYNKHYQNKDRIYRLVIMDEHNGKTRKSFYMPAALSIALMKDYPEIEIIRTLL